MNTTLQNPTGGPVVNSTAPPTSNIVTLPTHPAELAPHALGIRQILVPIDFSETSLKALQYAVAFARQFAARLTLLHVVEIPVYAESPYAAPLGYEELKAVKKELEAIRSAKIPEEIPVEVTVRQNAAFEGIIEVARECSADLIITATHGRTGLTHLLLGSTAEHLVRRAPCPVLVVRECEHEFV